ncbi:universal stress protein [Rhodobacteraceae bacterium 2CG4]|uniref:Universal stress protein n=1 Tax=Halovulum marinum TaxID=2662447 RepID=A0A6L5YUL7_9RHOB|nr:universal stress protein [Halovulum marinum]MSU88023.1 universal stress protein [Halovulum marinum]
MTDKMMALIDGSDYARSVCEHAAWIAGRTGLAVELVHVLGRRETGGRTDLSGSISLGARTALLEELSRLDEQRAQLVTRRGRMILDDARAILAEAGVERASVNLRHGDLLETLADLEPQAAMVLIGKRGEAADFARGHLGSNLERVVRATRKPLFVANRAFKPINRVLIAYDGGPAAMKAIDHVSRSRLFADLEIRIVTVGKSGAAAERGLADARAALAAAGLTADTALLPGEPAAVLGPLVEDEGFDMVVMGAYGQGRLHHLFVGSTTTEMIRACKVPLLLLH